MKHPSSPVSIIQGAPAILEAIGRGESLEKIYMLRTASGEKIGAIRQQARRAAIPISWVPAEKLRKLCRGFEGEALALGALVEYQDLESLISQVQNRGQIPLLALLDGVTDTRNLGAIGRSLYGCGGHGLILPTSSSAAITSDSVIASAHTLSQLPIARVPSVAQGIDLLRQHGIQVLASDRQGARPVHELDLRSPTCFILGSEDKGIGKESRRMADQLVHIPMGSDLDSFNVSVAAGMFFYETMMQRDFGLGRKPAEKV